MNGILDFGTWGEWVLSLDAAGLFLLILALVVAVVVVWSSSLQPDKTNEHDDDELNT